MSEIELKLLKNILAIFSTNVLNLFTSFINSFIVPSFLSVKEYALYKTFVLYSSLIGILHFGYADGIYMKYGGYTLEKIDKKELRAEFNFLVCFQFILTCALLLVSLSYSNLIMFFFAISILPTNLQTFISFVYQAIGELRRLAFRKGFNSVTVLLVNIFIVFVLKKNSYLPFVISNVLINYLFFIWFFTQLKKDLKVDVMNPLWAFRNTRFEIRQLFISGILVMLGNLSYLFFYTIDQWFIKIFFSMEIFAFYSFGISMVNVINTLISAVSVSMYSYLFHQKSMDSLILIRKFLLILSYLGSYILFLFKLFVPLFLKKYIPSLEIISILFTGIPAMTVINVLYVNLYKSQKREKKYFFTVFLMLILSVTTNIIATLFFRTPRSIAMATTLTYYVWFFYSIIDFKELRYKMNEVFSLIVYVGLIFLLSSAKNVLLEIEILFAGTLLTVFLFHTELRLILRKFIEILKK